MKVHRIITSVELTNLYPTNDNIPLAITNLTTNGNADDIEQVYDSVNKHRLGIAGKLKVSLVLLIIVLVIMNLM